MESLKRTTTPHTDARHAMPRGLQQSHAQLGAIKQPRGASAGGGLATNLTNGGAVGGYTVMHIENGYSTGRLITTCVVNHLSTILCTSTSLSSRAF